MVLIEVWCELNDVICDYSDYVKFGEVFNLMFGEDDLVVGVEFDFKFGFWYLYGVEMGCFNEIVCRWLSYVIW